MSYRDAMSSAEQRDKGEESWRVFSESMHDSLERLEEIINDITELRQVCRDEWCEATECMLDEATVAAFAISEPRWASPEDSKKLRDLKKRIHDLHEGLKSFH